MSRSELSSSIDEVYGHEELPFFSMVRYPNIFVLPGYAIFVPSEKVNNEGSIIMVSEAPRNQHNGNGEIDRENHRRA